MRMVREWRHLKMLKRTGRGHDPAGLEMTQEGECATLCPACPHPGKNLPKDWKNVPKEKMYVLRHQIFGPHFCQVSIRPLRGH